MDYSYLLKEVVEERPNLFKIQINFTHSMKMKSSISKKTLHAKDQEYHRASNLIYFYIHPVISKGLMNTKKEIEYDKIGNLAWYDIQHEELSYFFQDAKSKDIHYVFFEHEYDKESESIRYNNYSGYVTNNFKLKKREIVDRLFIICEDRKTKKWEFWMSTLRGEHKQLIHTFDKDTEWQLDVFNQKTLFFKIVNEQVHITAKSWNVL